MSPPAFPEETDQHRANVRDAILESARTLGIATEDAPSTDARVGRQGSVFGPTSDVAKRIVLIDKGDGAFEWRDAEPTRPLYVSPRDAREMAANGATPLVVLPVEKLGENAITAKLAQWDHNLNPNEHERPLLRWHSEQAMLVPVAAVPAIADSANRPKGILLIVHGTFSLGRGIFEQLNADSNPHGRAFLAWASTQYEHVLSFEHPTLSVSPVLNGLDLARLFASVQSPVDVICHSRGGLVTRWWLEAFEGAKRGPRRVVFVSAPLGGTSLASPVKLREAMNLFTSVGSHLRDVLGIGSAYLPFLNVGTMLAQIVVMATGTLASTPLSDLFFSAVPGLGAMSRVGNQPELKRLQCGSHDLSAAYYAICSDFRMEDAGWKFWKHFTKLGVAQWGADLIFEQANDLVVDNLSAIELFQGLGLRPDHYLNFPKNGKVYHTNYFTDTDVIGKLRDFLA
jgi:hypothetical protein